MGPAYFVSLTSQPPLKCSVSYIFLNDPFTDINDLISQNSYTSIFENTLDNVVIRVYSYIAITMQILFRQMYSKFNNDMNTIVLLESRNTHFQIHPYKINMQFNAQ